MDHNERLADELLFEADGHVSELVLTCLADGEGDLVPESAHAHVDACDACTTRLGEVALLSLEVDLELAASAYVRSEARPEAEVASVYESGHESGRANEALVRPAPEARVPQRRPLPVFAIAAALAVALLAAAPSLLGSERKLIAFGSEVMRAVPLVVRIVMGVFEASSGRSGTLAVALEWVSAGILIALGATLSRVMTRRQRLQGGVG